MAPRETTAPLNRRLQVDQGLQTEMASQALERFGRPLAVASVRESLQAVRTGMQSDPPEAIRQNIADLATAFGALPVSVASLTKCSFSISTAWRM
ncbi:hypothetical protein J2Y48_001067 [Mycoplana sp. BE70]|uniref:hypothetical protein n=1 Tax=Mycoplana sp. BE70 TaxID=2817775 RepID=UPI0028568056|nr:hypothetical protein [Mycoplana sp. BE70]MDR6755782.1 hypothetical protein [Mycoplana sp. BE70]